MKTPDFDEKRFRQLLAEALDGQLDEAGRQEFNRLLTASAKARREYRALMDLHARLHLEYTGGSGADFMPDAAPARTGKPHPVRRTWWIAAAAAIALLAVLVSRSDDSSKPFATLESARSSRWSSSDFPTAEGSRLGAGTLRLVEGLATLRFDSGAEVSLEAPADLKLVDSMNCQLLTGTAVANVPEAATGFRIETPSAMVIDYGTRFAVSVDPRSGGTRTQVFEGLVEVKNPATGDVVSLKTGQRASVEGRQTGPIAEGFEERFHPETSDPSPKGSGWILRTASKDAYIGYDLVTDSKELLYVKHGESDFHRKTYLGFDLSGLEPERIGSAELMLQFEPTGLGLASHVPDATFAVYGLLAADHPWDENNLRPHNAPANIRGTGDQLIADEVIKLGTFMVPQGVQRGRFGIDGETLADHLRNHAGSAITLILVRETMETASTGLVHGIASHRHPTLPAPTLAIRLREE
jgi:ferric-dicitrate binding protein FerR (iron transport regulator)